MDCKQYFSLGSRVPPQLQDGEEQPERVFHIKDNICGAIKYYFKINGWDESSSFFVIQVDDTDMQLCNASKDRVSVYSS